ncbi:DUF2924 domain-containing protein [Hyphomonas sp.]|uniref:DUF2924 domain-containing protein n=1 Tax=Hyphomonas sp. TaxID=87 RepID=UPI003F712072
MSDTLALETLANSDRIDLASKWKEAFGQPPPPRISQSMMLRILASEHQWKASGENRPALVRRIAKLADRKPDSGPATSSGARLVREWNGRKHTVDVTDDGFVWNGQMYRSLSAIAREITGARWSGPRFFGVRA